MSGTRLSSILFLAVVASAAHAAEKVTDRFEAQAARQKTPPGRELCSSDLGWADTRDRVAIDAFHLRLICGDKENPAWEHVPEYQGEFHLKAYLQSKGYFAPIFSQDPADAKLRVVEPGPQLHLGRIDLVPIREALAYELKFYQGKVLTPDLLNLLETRSRVFFRNQGHACADVTSQVVIESGSAHITIEAKNLYKFGVVTREKVKGIDEHVFERYSPFEPETTFSDDLLNLARKRVLRDGVVEGTYFDENCKRPDEPLLKQNFVVTSPRTLRMGVGFNTEEGPFGQVMWENDRYGTKAAHLSATAYASIKLQKLESDARYYPFVETPRFFWAPEFEVYRDASLPIVETSASFAFKPGYQHDFASTALTWKAGPAFVLSWFHNRDLHTRELRDGSVALQSEATFQTHSWELFDAHAQRGFWMKNAIDMRHPALGFFAPYLGWDQSAKAAGLLGYCLGGRCYVAWRHQFQIKLIENPQQNLSRLPPSLSAALGDVPTLRGFRQTRLPNPGLTSLSEGVELRMNGVPAAAFEAYTFLDAGKLGYERFSLAHETYMAPGLGLRWFSPVGVVNVFIDRSLALAHTLPNEWYFYVGLGDGF